jgi:DNA-binding response OmpR family regulator
MTRWHATGASVAMKWLRSSHPASVGTFSGALVMLLALGAVCRRLRARHRTALRIVALTGRGQEKHRRRSREAGFDLHLVKPVDALDGSGGAGGVVAVLGSSTC